MCLSSRACSVPEFKDHELVLQLRQTRRNKKERNKEDAPERKQYRQQKQFQLPRPLEAELRVLKLGALVKRARDMGGIDEVAVTAAEDDDDPKAALVSLMLARVEVTAAERNDSAGTTCTFTFPTLDKDPCSHDLEVRLCSVRRGKIRAKGPTQRLADRVATKLTLQMPRKKGEPIDVGTCSFEVQFIKIGDVRSARAHPISITSTSTSETVPLYRPVVQCHAIDLLHKANPRESDSDVVGRRLCKTCSRNMRPWLGLRFSHSARSSQEILMTTADRSGRTCTRSPQLANALWPVSPRLLLHGRCPALLGLDGSRRGQAARFSSCGRHARYCHGDICTANSRRKRASVPTKYISRVRSTRVHNSVTWAGGIMVCSGLTRRYVAPGARWALAFPSQSLSQRSNLHYKA